MSFDVGHITFNSLLVTQHKAHIDDHEHDEKCGHVFERLGKQSQDKLELFEKTELSQKVEPRKSLQECKDVFVVLALYDRYEQKQQSCKVQAIPKSTVLLDELFGRTIPLAMQLNSFASRLPNKPENHGPIFWVKRQTSYVEAV